MTAPKYGVSGERSLSLSKAWRTKELYTNGLYGTPFHNTWRAIRFTGKGQKAGWEERWQEFKNFREDMYSSFSEGLRICRRDKKLPFSKENCFWTHPSNLSEHKLTQFEYRGETKTLREWCIRYELNYTGVMCRFHARKKDSYTPHEILFGKGRKRRKTITDQSDLTHQKLRDKASKMLASYRCKDRKRKYPPYEISIEWFIENILKAKCIYCASNQKLGAERIDNNDSHAIHNIKPACYRCNVVRGDRFSHEQMKKIGQFIRENIDHA